MLRVIFWVVCWRLVFNSRRFGTLCLFHVHRRVDIKSIHAPMKIEQTHYSETSAIKHHKPGTNPKITRKNVQCCVGILFSSALCSCSNQHNLWLAASAVFLQFTPLWRPAFDHRADLVGFAVDKVTGERIMSDYFCFPFVSVPPMLHARHRPRTADTHTLLLNNILTLHCILYHIWYSTYFSIYFLRECFCLSATAVYQIWYSAMGATERLSINMLYHMWYISI
jgi:hypothetical protein